MLHGDDSSEITKSDQTILDHNKYSEGIVQSVQNEPKLIAEHATEHRKNHNSTVQRIWKGDHLFKKKLQINANGTNYLIPINTPKSKNRNVFQCSFCYKIFNKKRNHADHENTHTGKRPSKRPHKCPFPLCPSTFGSSSALLWHKIAIHNQKKRHMCSVCEIQFVRKSYLDIHTREKHLPDTDSRRYFQCKLCDNKFDTSFKLSYHKLRVHNKNAPTFTCDYCQRIFNNRQVIVSHMHLHSGIKNFKCRYCKKDFGSKTVKTQHEQKCVRRMV